MKIQTQMHTRIHYMHKCICVCANIIISKTKKGDSNRRINSGRNGKTVCLCSGTFGCAKELTIARKRLLCIMYFAYFQCSLHSFDGCFRFAPKLFTIATHAQSRINGIHTIISIDVRVVSCTICIKYYVWTLNKFWIWM